MNASSEVHSLAPCIYHQWAPHRLFAFMASTQLTAYIDESGTHGPSPLTVMAGFVGYADQWDKFDSEWKNLLASNRLDYIHGKELLHGSGQFKDRSKWNLDARAALAIHIAPVPLRYARYSISVVLNNRIYDEHYIGSDRKLRKHKHPIDSKYGVCCRIFMSMVANSSKDMSKTLAKYIWFSRPATRTPGLLKPFLPRCMILIRT